MSPFTEEDWLGTDHPIVRRSKAEERQARGDTHIEHRVIGPPGCGKTTWLSRQATIAAGKYGGDGVILASLTRTAAQEIAGRDTPIPRENIGTLHAHCYRALDRPALAEIPDGIREWNNWIREHGKQPIWTMDTGRQAGDLDHAPAEIEHGRTEGEMLRNRLAVLRARQTPIDTASPELQRFAEAWAEFKNDSHRLDFTDLIEQCVQRRIAPHGNPGVIMLDEAQDMSRLELALARMWAAACEQLVVVCDPAQALYQWRGSDPEALFASPAESERVLEQSYRVPRAVHAYAVNWIRQMPGYRDFAYQPTDVDGQVIKLHAHPWQTPTGLLDLIARDQDDGMTVMVLATCGYMLNPLTATLKTHGIPYHNPYRPTHGGWNPMRGAERLLAFLRPDNTVHGDQARMWTYGDVRRWMEPLKAAGLLTRGAKTWIEAKNLKDRFGESAEDLQAGLAQIAGLFADEQDAGAAFDTDVDWWYRNHLPKASPASTFPVRVYHRHGGRALLDKPRLIVGTVHSVKGGEADSVYLWPDLSLAAHNAEWTVPQRRAPVYRTFYVAMTRARRKLTILPESAHTYVHLPDPATISEPR